MSQTPPLFSARSAWGRDDLANDPTWVYDLPPEALLEMARAARRLPDDPQGWLEVRPEDIDAPRLKAQIAAVADELESGRGVALAHESGVLDAELFLALALAGDGAAARVRIAKPATRQPSMSLCGSLRMISRSLHVPGSDSSALTTRYCGVAVLFLGMNDHLRPEGKPAPPRPRRPDAFMSAMIVSGPRSTSSLVLCQSPCKEPENQRQRHRDSYRCWAAEHWQQQGSCRGGGGSAPVSWQPRGRVTDHCTSW